MRGIVATTTQDAGRLLQFGVLEIKDVKRSVKEVEPGFVGALLEVELREVKNHLLKKEDCYAISVPVEYVQEHINYGIIYSTPKAVMLRNGVVI